jgi:hypothetical protein
MISIRKCKAMTENAIRVYNTPNGPQVYFGTVRIHHWQAGLASAVIGALGLRFDDDKKRKNLYGALLIGGAVAFLDDLPDFIKFIDDLLK